CARIYYSNCDW
nr:immunoglobulin heavy chain junction region [Mus musculus]